jgi:hypothetical protein
MTAIGLFLLLPVRWAAVPWAVFGLIAMEIGTRRGDGSLIDVRLGRASMLVAAFATYGFAMLTVARCPRHHTSQLQAIRVTGSGDTFAEAAPEKNAG